MTPVTSVPSRIRVGHAGQVAERRVALEHVLPLAPDLRDLEEVVHQPQAREAGLLGGARDLGERGGGRRRAPGPAEARDLQPELERQRRLLPGARRRRARRGSAGGTSSTGPAAVDAGEALAGERVAERRLRLAQLRGDDLRRDRRRARAVALAHDGVRRVEHDRVGRHAVPLGQRAPRRRGAWRSSPVVSITVVSPRARRFATIRSSSSNASRLARWSRSPRPTTARSRSDETTWSGWNHSRRPVRLPRRRRARRARRGTGRAGAASLVDDDVGRRPQPQHLRAASSASCPPGRRA